MHRDKNASKLSQEQQNYGTKINKTSTESINIFTETSKSFLLLSYLVQLVPRHW